MRGNIFIYIRKKCTICVKIFAHNLFAAFIHVDFLQSICHVHPNFQSISISICQVAKTRKNYHCQMLSNINLIFGLSIYTIFRMRTSVVTRHITTCKNSFSPAFFCFVNKLFDNNFYLAHSLSPLVPQSATTTTTTTTKTHIDDVLGGDIASVHACQKPFRWISMPLAGIWQSHAYSIGDGILIQIPSFFGIYFFFASFIYWTKTLVACLFMSYIFAVDIYVCDETWLSLYVRHYICVVWCVRIACYYLFSAQQIVWHQNESVRRNITRQ